ncbi:CPBP family intramembrane glutamic endopeptidase [Enterococcus sp. LJL99]
MAKKRKEKIKSFLGVLVILVLSFFNDFLTIINVPPLINGMIGNIIWNWFIVALLFFYIFRVEKRTVASIGLKKPTGDDLKWAFYFWGMSNVWYVVLNFFFPQSELNEGISTITSLTLPLVLLLVITTAFCEEVIWRGFLMERIYELTGYIWLGASISFVIFIIPHIQVFGYEWLIYHAFGSSLLYVLYVWRRNLWSTILLHFLINIPIVIPTLFS